MLHISHASYGRHRWALVPVGVTSASRELLCWSECWLCVTGSPVPCAGRRAPPSTAVPFPQLCPRQLQARGCLYAWEGALLFHTTPTMSWKRSLCALLQKLSRSQCRGQWGDARGDGAAGALWRCGAVVLWGGLGLLSLCSQHSLCACGPTPCFLRGTLQR